MKINLLKTILLLAFFLVVKNACAQVPQSVPYQAVARNTNGNLIAAQTISIRFSIHDATSGGTVIYQETQSATTNALGLFSANIGNGTPVAGTFADINWGSGSKFIQIEIDLAGGNSYANMGTSQMMSVPYALYAATSGTAIAITGIVPVANGGTGATTLTANNVLIGNGTSALQAVAPGSTGNVLTSNGTTWTSVAASATGVPYTGATGSVNLGAYDLTVNGLTFGLGASSIVTNLAIGNNTLLSNTTGTSNTAIGIESLKKNTVGFDNTAFGAYSLNTNQNGARNTALGQHALYLANDAYDNTAVGYLTLQNNTTGNFNVAVGSEALIANTSATSNTALGSKSLHSNTIANGNTAIGDNSLYSNSTGGGNTAVGQSAMYSNTTSTNNAAFGGQSLEQNSTGYSNTAIGTAAIDRNKTGANNAVLGAYAGRYIGDGSTSNTEINNGVLIGADSKPLADQGTNEIVIGYNATGNGSNTVQIGNTSITNVKTSGTLTTGVVTYPKTDGTSGQVLTTNGSGTPTWTTIGSEVADEFTATDSQTSFTLSQTPSVNSKVKMYIKGIRISNTAYSVSGTTLTYVPANNGAYAISVSDMVQFDYYK